ncbi:MAG: OB-fold domain-containing protein [Deltaproteobacteria bacterium]|nr:OB-fold domain-containing protein [Deltaproteobacteria bacterium]
MTSHKIERVSVLGAGLMGNGIAQVAAQSGYQVAMMDIDDETLARGVAAIKKSLGRMTKRGKISKEEAADVISRIRTSVDLEDAVKEADLVIEAVPEDLDLKRETFGKLDGFCPPHTILASNTSNISISTIASATQRSDKVIGLHFANPVPIMKGVEVITGLDTSEETLKTAKEVIYRMGKDFYVAKDAPGFLGNRAFPLFLNEAMNVLWEGIGSAEDIDKCAKLSFGHPMGPLELADFIGLDQLLKGLNYLRSEWGDKYRPSPLMKQLVAAGHYGRKTGRGVFKYDARGMKIRPKKPSDIKPERIAFQEGLFTEENGGALIAGKCTACGKVFFPRRSACTECAGSDMEVTHLKDGGKIYTHTTVNMPVHKFKPPFTIAWVEFPEGVRVMAPVKDGQPQSVKVGMETTLVIDTLWREKGKEVVGYKFRPIA